MEDSFGNICLEPRRKTNLGLSSEPKSCENYCHISPFLVEKDIICKSQCVLASNEKAKKVAFALQLPPDCLKIVEKSLVIGPTGKNFTSGIFICLSMASNTGSPQAYSQVQLEVNGKCIPLPRSFLGPRTSAPEPIEITEFCGLCYTVPDIVNISLPGVDGNTLFVKICLMNKLEVRDLECQIRARKVMPVTRTMDMIREKLQGDVEIVAETLKASILCPISKLPITIPCRVATCCHLQCFDLVSFLRLNKENEDWMCPVCKKAVLFDDLAVDSYFLTALQSPRILGNATHISIDALGNWEPIHGNNGDIFTLDVSHLSPAPALSPPLLPSKYIISKTSLPTFDVKIGQSARCEVFCSKYEKQFSAVKRYFGVEDDPSLERAILQEAANIYELKHKYVVGLLFVSPEAFCIGLEYCKKIVKFSDGKLRKFSTARQLLNVMSKMVDSEITPRLFFELSKQAAEGMVHLHQFSVVHSNLRTENIMVTVIPGVPSSWLFKISDFYGKDLQTLTKSPHIEVHNISFIAPERLISGVNATKESDVYSFGMILYELHNCRIPYPYAKEGMCDVDGIKKEIGAGKLPDTSGMQEKFRMLFQACCAHTPDSRPTMEAVYSLLTGLSAKDFVTRIGANGLPSRTVCRAENGKKGQWEQSDALKDTSAITVESVTKGQNSVPPGVVSSHLGSQLDHKRHQTPASRPDNKRIKLPASEPSNPPTNHVHRVKEDRNVPQIPVILKPASQPSRSIEAKTSRERQDSSNDSADRSSDPDPIDFLSFPAKSGEISNTPFRHSSRVRKASTTNCSSMYANLVSAARSCEAYLSKKVKECSEEKGSGVVPEPVFESCSIKDEPKYSFQDVKKIFMPQSDSESESESFKDVASYDDVRISGSYRTLEDSRKCGIGIVAGKLGIAQLRNFQEVAIQSFYDRKDCLVVSGPSSGKSVIPQILGSLETGVLVILPNQLMQEDWSDKLKRLDVSSAVLRSTDSIFVLKKRLNRQPNFLLTTLHFFTEMVDASFIEILKEQVYYLVIDELQLAIEAKGDVNENLDALARIRSFFSIIPALYLTAALTPIYEQQFRELLAGVSVCIKGKVLPSGVNYIILRSDKAGGKLTPGKLHKLAKLIQAKRSAEHALVYLRTLEDCTKLSIAFNGIGCNAVQVYSCKKNLRNSTKDDRVEILLAPYDADISLPKLKHIFCIGMPMSLTSWIRMSGRATGSGNVSATLLVSEVEDVDQPRFWNTVSGERKLASVDILEYYFCVYSGSCLGQFANQYFEVEELAYCECKCTGCEVGRSVTFKDCSQLVSTLLLAVQSLISQFEFVSEELLRLFLQGELVDSIDFKGHVDGSIFQTENIDIVIPVLLRQCVSIGYLGVGFDFQQDVVMCFFLEEKGTSFLHCENSAIRLPPQESIFWNLCDSVSTPSKKISSSTKTLTKSPSKPNSAIGQTRKKSVKQKFKRSMVQRIRKDLASERWETLRHEEQISLLGYLHDTTRLLYIPNVNDLTGGQSSFWKLLKLTRSAARAPMEEVAAIGRDEPKTFFIRRNDCAGVNVCSEKGCKTSCLRSFSSIRCEAHPDKRFEHRACGVVFIFISPEDPNDTRRWVGTYKREPVPANHDHFLPDMYRFDFDETTKFLSNTY